MQYIIEYELCALLFLGVIGIQFFSKPRFPNKQNKLFGVILLCAAADLGLDVISAKTIEHAQSVPLWLNIAISEGYYFLQILLPALLMVYVITLAGCRSVKRPFYLLCLPAVVSEIILFTNPFTKVFFYFDASLKYARGPWEPFLCLEGLFYLIATAILLCRRQQNMKKKQHILILHSFFAIELAMTIQQLYPRLLITGLSSTVALTMMFFTLQNPDSMLDIMSGAFNYSALLLFLQNPFSEKKEFQLIALDLCDMRRINSLFGLLAGNEVISEVGKFLLESRKKAWVFRMTGTRYVVITYSEDYYQALLKKVENRFAYPWRVEGISMMLSCKVRHFSSAQLYSTPGDLVNLLDIAFSELPGMKYTSLHLEIDGEILSAIHRRLAVETAVRQALETGQGFELYFQPIYSLRKERFTMAEALLRFTHPVLGEISPVEFIPIAEKNGLAVKIDEWVIRHCCSFVQRYCLQTRLGLGTIEINLSAAGILQNFFPDKLLEITNSYGIDPSFIMFEITETAATTAHDLLSGCMTEMQMCGFRFALDDYGAGYANIAQVVNLPFYAVKLDRSLLVPQTYSKNTDVVFEDTLRMFRRMGKITVVEGVETEEEIARIRTLEADYIQGFVYAEPMPEKDFIAFLTEFEAESCCLTPD